MIYTGFGCLAGNLGCGKKREYQKCPRSMCSWGVFMSLNFLELLDDIFYGFTIYWAWLHLLKMETCH